MLDITVKNVGNIPSLTVTGTGISGTGAAEFSVLTTGNTCRTGVTPGNTCWLPAQFAPSLAGSYSATLTVNTNGGQNPTVALSGTGD